MDIEIGAEAKDKRLNQRVAITVVGLSIFMGLAGVKDGNIVQAMQQAQSSNVDAWNEYQATKSKLHVDETALAQVRLLALAGDARAGAAVGAETARLAALADEGKLTVEVARTFGLDRVGEAFGLSQSGHVRGKLIIVP